MSDDELTRDREFNREKLSFPLYFLMDLWVYLGTQCCTCHSNMGSRSVLDLWRMQKGRQIYLSIVVILVPWPETKYSQGTSNILTFSFVHYSSTIIEDLLCTRPCDWDWNIIVSKSNMASVLMGEILEKIMHTNNRMTNLMFFFVDVWFQISFSYGKILTEDILPLVSVCFPVPCLSWVKA